ncbi:peroxiredoxin family protein [Paenibacillaceae bacterium WGS1546]|uniref:peroxiredoxin family protein n=1 Tax=Cohnella sp. WGS1546 TaxID=3366810 RepID=UPI00372D7BA3
MQLGTFVLNLEMLIYLAAGMAGVLAVRYRHRRDPDRERLVSGAWNAAFLWLLVWKGSLILFDPSGVLAHPQSLLFFSGGARGAALASVAAAGYLVRSNAKRLGFGGAVMLAATWGAGMAAVACGSRVLLADNAGFVDYALLALATVVLAVLLSPSRKVAAQALGIALVAAMIASATLDPGDRRGIRDNEAAPDFALADLNGNEVRLSDYRGRTVVLNFWATWCTVCRAEMPHVERFYQDHLDKDVVVLSVNATSQERDAGRVKRYADEEALSFPIVLDEDGAVLSQYRVTAYPTTFVIGPEGDIRGRYLGAISYEQMKKVARAEG